MEEKRKSEDIAGMAAQKQETTNPQGTSKFFAMMSRMKYIDRWALMRNTFTENICEHSLEVAMIAHLLCVIGNKRFNKNLDAEHAALIGIYHDTTEIITGDMPTPIKYFNEEIRRVFHGIEDNAAEKLLAMLPEDLREEYRTVFFKGKGEDEQYLWRLVKAADKLSAWIKCIEEQKAGNHEFDSARRAAENSVHAMKLPEAECFVKEFLPAYENTLDELQKND